MNDPRIQTSSTRKEKKTPSDSVNNDSPSVHVHKFFGLLILMVGYNRKQSLSKTFWSSFLEVKFVIQSFPEYFSSFCYHQKLLDFGSLEGRRNYFHPYDVQNSSRLVQFWKIFYRFLFQSIKDWSTYLDLFVTLVNHPKNRAVNTHKVFKTAQPYYVPNFLIAYILIGTIEELCEWYI